MNEVGRRDSGFVMTPEEMVARLLYRDALMLVIDKPAGMAVHRGPKGGASLEDHFDALRFGLPRAPALAHRLDRDTSGCLALGRHRKALAELGRLFKAGAIGKTYWAVVEGGPPEDEGRIDLALGRLDDTRGWWMKPDPHGQPAATAWKVMGRSAASSGASLTWLALEPLTGRTHQLRCTAARAGDPRRPDLRHGAPPKRQARRDRLRACPRDRGAALQAARPIRRRVPPHGGAAQVGWRNGKLPPGPGARGVTLSSFAMVRAS